MATKNKKTQKLNIKQLAQKNIKPLCVLGLAFLVLVGFGFFAINKNDGANRQTQDSSSQTESNLTSGSSPENGAAAFEDCANSEDSTIEVDNGSTLCTTKDAAIYEYPEKTDKDEDQKKDIEEPEITEEEIEKSLRVDVEQYSIEDGWDNISFNIPEGENQTALDINIKISGITLSDCSASVSSTPDVPNNASSTTTEIEALATQKYNFTDGQHSISVACETNNETYTSVMNIGARDHKPEQCTGYDFDSPESTTTSLQDAKDKIIGTWEGCVDTPGHPDYYVTFVFKEDGTYNAFSTEVIDRFTSDSGISSHSFSGESASKVYRIDTSSDGVSQGAIEIPRNEEHTPVDSTLRNIKASDDRLTFDIIYEDSHSVYVYNLHKAE